MAHTWRPQRIQRFELLLLYMVGDSYTTAWKCTAAVVSLQLLAEFDETAVVTCT